MDEGEGRGSNYIYIVVAFWTRFYGEGGERERAYDVALDHIVNYLQDQPDCHGRREQYVVALWTRFYRGEGRERERAYDVALDHNIVNYLQDPPAELTEESLDARLPFRAAAGLPPAWLKPVACCWPCCWACCWLCCWPLVAAGWPAPAPLCD